MNERELRQFVNQEEFGAVVRMREGRPDTGADAQLISLYGTEFYEDMLNAFGLPPLYRAAWATAFGVIIEDRVRPRQVRLRNTLWGVDGIRDLDHNYLARQEVMDMPIDTIPSALSEVESVLTEEISWPLKVQVAQVLRRPALAFLLSLDGVPVPDRLEATQRADEFRDTYNSVHAYYLDARQRIDLGQRSFQTAESMIQDKMDSILLQRLVDQYGDGVFRMLGAFQYFAERGGTFTSECVERATGLTSYQVRNLKDILKDRCYIEQTNSHWSSVRPLFLLDQPQNYIEPCVQGEGVTNLLWDSAALYRGIRTHGEAPITLDQMVQHSFSDQYSTWSGGPRGAYYELERRGLVTRKAVGNKEYVFTVEQDFTDEEIWEGLQPGERETLVENTTFRGPETAPEETVETSVSGSAQLVPNAAAYRQAVSRYIQEQIEQEVIEAIAPYETRLVKLEGELKALEAQIETQVKTQVEAKFANGIQGQLQNFFKTVFAFA